jgi:hypothetical protein
MLPLHQVISMALLERCADGDIDDQLHRLQFQVSLVLVLAPPPPHLLSHPQSTYQPTPQLTSVMCRCQCYCC